AVPVLEELPGGGVGEVPSTPIVRWLLEQGGCFPRFCQSVLLSLPIGVEREHLLAAVQAVVETHDMLRARLHRVGDDEWRLQVLPADAVRARSLLVRVPVAAVTGPEFVGAAAVALEAAAGRLDPQAGVVAQVVWFDAGAGRPGRLLVVAHHLVVDGVSWRILVPDLAAAWARAAAGRPVELEPVGTSMRRWAHGLVEASRAEARVGELELWRTVLSGEDPVLGSRPLDPAIDVGATVETVTVEVPAGVTDPLLTALPAAFHGGVNDGLLAGLALAVTAWRRERGSASEAVSVGVEGHGREEQVVPGADLSRTVGWFTSVFPVRLDLAGIDLDEALDGGVAAGAAIKAVKEQLRAVPDHGIGYGMLRYLNDETRVMLGSRPGPQIGFNYLGRIAAAVSGVDPEAGWLPVTDVDLGAVRDPGLPASAVVAVDAMAVETEAGWVLRASFSFPAGVLTEAEVRALARRWEQALGGLAGHAVAPGAGGHTPSDFALVSLPQPVIEALEQRYRGLEEVWPLTPLQHGLLFHALHTESVDAYVVQLTLHLSGRPELPRLRRAAEALLARHPNLRVAFPYDVDADSVQVVQGDVELPLREVDLSGVDEQARGTELDRILTADRAARFDTALAPLLRLTAISLRPDDFRLVFTNHHLLLDGWSAPLLLRELLALYAADGDVSVLPPVRAYRDYLAWLGRRDVEAARAAWVRALAGVERPTLLAAAGSAQVEEVTEEIRQEVPEELTGRLEALARRRAVTPNTIVQAAWAVVLATLTGRADVVFGATVSGRPAEVPGIEQMIGLFINTIPVRVALDSYESLGGLLERVQAEQAGLLEHHHLGLTEIQRVVGPAAGFDTLTVFESYPVDRAGLTAATDLAGMRVTDVTVHETGDYPVTVVAHTAGDRLHLRFVFRPSLFDHEDIQRIANRMDRALAAFADEPDLPLGRLQLLDETELGRLAPVENPRSVPEATWGQIFEAQVARSPHAVAAVCGEQRLTYAQFDARSNRLARLLIDRGIGPESHVAVAMRRSLDLLVAICAIVKAGGAFVPVDPDHPAERIEHMLTDSQAVLGVTVAAERERLPG
ncbi:AMP-binding protein, partial [Rhodococcus sp. 14C212]|uniref:condensation domain-containing protein n=1 Tax=Rhodococcus sp. 14C212 TaxID=2711209 RepID=UPI0013EB7D20